MVECLPVGWRQVPVQRWSRGARSAVLDRVADEVPLALEYNGVAHAVMMASPVELEDFALGFSLTEGVVDRPAQLYEVDVCETGQGLTVRMTVASACLARLSQRRRTLAGPTGCGLCGTERLEHVFSPWPALAPSQLRYEPSAVLRGIQGLCERQPLRAATGVTHAAGWCDSQGQLRLVREDVGRHNALDKLVGALARSHRPPQEVEAGFVVITSRASHEMVHKVLALRVPLLAAVSGVTSLAIDTARQGRLSLLGFVRDGDFAVYSHGERLGLES